jgi:hypothetical protein
MSKGVLLFAHNSRDIDYALMAVISGGLAKKNLQVPVSIATDSATLDWVKQSKIYDTFRTIFDQVILTDRPVTDNKRNLYDGKEFKIVPFINANRFSAWDLTPYDRTLLIDVDFLIFSKSLNEYWNIAEDIMISKSINDVCSQQRLGYHDKYISDTGIHLYWATTVMFTKNKKSKLFFDLVRSIKDNYQIYSDIYRFNSQQYRNDIAFSLAKHILDGFETRLENSLPPVLTAIDKDVLFEVKLDNLTILINDIHSDGFIASSFKNIDLHVMNKQSIIRNSKKLMELI